MKKILVTGATGFIGNYVINELLAKGFTVVATSVSEDKARSKDWYSKTKYIPFDLKAMSVSENYYNFFDKPDILLHLAWEGLPNYTSDFHMQDNLPRHFAFLKNLLIHGLKDVAITGTCFEYGMQEGCLSEDMPSLPANQYAIAKNTLRLRLIELCGTISFDLKWIRLFYMYGEGQNPNSLFSQLQLALEKGEKVFNMSPGDQMRDYLPVEKVAKYIVKIATQKKVTGIINCCSGEPVAVKKLVADYLKERNAFMTLNLGFYPYSAIEPKNFWGDNTKLKTILLNE